MTYDDGRKLHVVLRQRVFSLAAETTRLVAAHAATTAGLVAASETARLIRPEAAAAARLITSAETSGLIAAEA